MSKQEAERLANVCAGLSWDGFNICGSIESIEQVKQMQHDAGTIPELKQRINSDAERIAELESARQVQDAALFVARTDFRELAIRAEQAEAQRDALLDLVKAMAAQEGTAVFTTALRNRIDDAIKVAGDGK